MAEVIRAEGISAGYGNTPVFDGLSFALKDGEVMALIGQNGSGKTTLLRALLGLMPLRKGSVKLFGKERLSPAERETLISYLPQRMEPDRTFPISLGEMLNLGSGGSAAKYTEMLGLGGLLHKRVGDLSGGQFQKALLAYSLSKEPKLLIMDEPTSWIDAKGSDCFLCVIEEFRKKGIAMIIVSHDFSVISPLATKVMGLGPSGHFILPPDSPELNERIQGLFATGHHCTGGVCHFVRIAGAHK